MYIRCEDFNEVKLNVSACSTEDRAIRITIPIRDIKSPAFNEVKKIVDFSSELGKINGGIELFTKHKWFLCEEEKPDEPLAISDAIPSDDPLRLKLGYILLIKSLHVEPTYIYSEELDIKIEATVHDEGKSIEFSFKLNDYASCMFGDIHYHNARIDQTKKLFSDHYWILVEPNKFKKLEVKNVLVTDDPEHFRFGYLLEI